jgi:uncharacterized membrane protein
MDKKHLLAAFIGLATILMAFVIGCSLVQVPTAQQTPIITSVLSFLAILGAQIWSKADTDRRLNKIETKTEATARREDCPPDPPFGGM